MRGKPIVLAIAFSFHGLIPARAGKTCGTLGLPCGKWAHPRACGENALLGTPTPVALGSSPRVRGKPGRGGGPVLRVGLIPARAGKTGRCSRRRWRARAHPRACGENRPSAATAPTRTGSSPRVRGKPDRGLEHVGSRRLIPARAGKTRHPHVWVMAGAAHPRACGENTGEWWTDQLGRGSSPRVRGKPAVGGDSTNAYRLIPARAGKTGSRSRACGLSPAHPRACGENPPPARVGDGRCGSSPRVRGKRPPGGPCVPRARLIPARAGKTPPRTGPGCGSRAHPRACGENTSPGCRRARGAGSSPRVRGKLVGVRPQRLRQRLIPARAGKTPSCGAPPSWRTAHPRACGENLSPVPAGWAQDGSSPRVRGKRGRADAPCRGGGLIPARAGKTG